MTPMIVEHPLLQHKISILYNKHHNRIVESKP